MALSQFLRAVRRALIAAVTLGALSGCGDQLPIFTGQGPAYDPNGTYDCCIDGNMYYICQTKLAYGQCLGTPPDPSQCTLQVSRDCPASANQ